MAQTLSSFGYANAVVPVRPDVMDERLNTLEDMVGDIHHQLAQLLQPSGIAAAVITPAIPIVVPSQPVPIPFYCHTHGVRKHHSHECTNPGPNHNNQATFKNRMGGSNYKPK
jgi:hypothetical protein